MNRRWGKSEHKSAVKYDMIRSTSKFANTNLGDTFPARSSVEDWDKKEAEPEKGIVGNLSKI